MPSWTSSESQMLQKQKQLKKGVDYEQVINVLAMDKSMLEEELRATNSKLKLYDRCYVSNVMILAANTTANAKQMLQMQLQMLAANATANVKQMHIATANATTNAKQMQ
ncbi:hypothetical protein Tco_0948481 [Tanacetum coccineum]